MSWHRPAAARGGTAARLVRGRGRDGGGRAALPVHEKKGAGPPAAGQGAGAEAGGSILDQPIHSIPASRAARLLASALEAEPRLEPRRRAGKSLTCAASPWQEREISGGLLPHKADYGKEGGGGP